MMTQQVPHGAPMPGSGGNVHRRIGVLTRRLHDALCELGYASQLRESAQALPDAQSRLAYIARLGQESADKVLGCVEQAKTCQRQLRHSSELLHLRLLRGKSLSTAELLDFVQEAQEYARRSDAHLTDIMLAQNFHDLTGQVMARVAALVDTLQTQLLQLLLETLPRHMPETDGAARPAGLAGPVIDPAKAPEALSSQEQVDDLLASLGF